VRRDRATPSSLQAAAAVGSAIGRRGEPPCVCPTRDVGRLGVLAEIGIGAALLGRRVRPPQAKPLKPDPLMVRSGRSGHD
jgi:hypothetical protein